MQYSGVAVAGGGGGGGGGEGSGGGGVVVEVVEVVVVQRSARREEATCKVHTSSISAQIGTSPWPLLLNFLAASRNLISTTQAHSTTYAATPVCRKTRGGTKETVSGLGGVRRRTGMGRSLVVKAINDGGVLCAR